MTTELDALLSEMREGLAKATPGPWFQTGSPWFRSGSGVVAGSPDGNIAFMVCDCDLLFNSRGEYEGPFPVGDEEADARHIARCSPSNILTLLDAYAAQSARISELEAGLREMREAGQERLGTESRRYWRTPEARAFFEKNNAALIAALTRADALLEEAPK